jgi:hypothetical protein
MVYFQTKNPNLGKFFRYLDRKILIRFMSIWNIWLIFWIFYDHFVHFSGFGFMYQEKSGNPYTKVSACTYLGRYIHRYVPETNLSCCGTSILPTCVANQQSYQCSFTERRKQGDQIGRNFAVWASVYFEQFFLITESAWSFVLFFPRYKFSIDFDKKWLRLHFSWFFHKLIWSPWVEVPAKMNLFFVAVYGQREECFPPRARVTKSLLDKIGL